MNDILEVIFEIFGFLTPTGRRKKKGVDDAESPFSNVELTSYIIYAIIGITIAWIFLYIIVINIIDWLYIRYLKSLKTNK